MPRNWSKAVHEGNRSVPQQEELGSDQPTLVNVYRLFEESFDRRLKIMKSRFDQQEKKLKEFMENMRATEQHSPSLEQDAWQPRLAMEADVPSDPKTRERTMAPLLQFKRSMGITVLQNGSKLARRVLPASVMTSLDLRLSLV